jgi:glycosyltransferase involved in cell wall biosynthesis
LRIAILSHFRPYPPTSGANYLIWGTANALAAQGHKVLLLSFGRGGNLSVIEGNLVFIHQEWSYWHRLPIALFRKVVQRIIPGTFPYELLLLSKIISSATPQLKSIIEKFNPQIIQVEMPYSFELAQKLARSSIPIVLREHNVEWLLTYLQIYFKKGLKGLSRQSCNVFREYEKEVCLKSDMVVTASYKDENIIRGMGINHVKTILPSYKLRLHDHKKRRDYGFTWLRFKPYILFVGIRWKPNVDATLRIKEVARRTKGVNFMISGSVCQALQQNELPENVRLLGVVNNEQLYSLYDEANATLIPIEFGSGVQIKLLEAMYFGIPIITTSFVASSLTKTPLNSYPLLYICNDMNDFIKAVEDVISNRSTLDEDELKWVRNFLSWSRSSSELIDTYYKLIKGKEE